MQRARERGKNKERDGNREWDIMKKSAIKIGEKSSTALTQFFSRKVGRYLKINRVFWREKKRKESWPVVVINNKEWKA